MLPTLRSVSAKPRSVDGDRPQILLVRGGAFPLLSPRGPTRLAHFFPADVGWEDCHRIGLKYVSRDGPGNGRSLDVEWIAFPGHAPEHDR